jgi:hypothetical protein
MFSGRRPGEEHEAVSAKLECLTPTPLVIIRHHHTSDPANACGPGTQGRNKKEAPTKRKRERERERERERKKERKKERKSTRERRKGPYGLVIYGCMGRAFCAAAWVRRRGGVF